MENSICSVVSEVIRNKQLHNLTTYRYYVYIELKALFRFDCTCSGILSKHKSPPVSYIIVDSYATFKLPILDPLEGK